MVENIKTLKALYSQRQIRISSQTVPLALLGILIMAFGLLITQLGFYQDDWHHIYFAHSLGLTRLWDMFLYDGRPLAAVLYMLGFSVLGFTPLHWHISTLILRYLTILFTWFYLKDIWPEHKREVTWAALLFVIYPLFKLQPLSVAYTVHWTGFLLFSISIWAMVQSIAKPRWFWLFTFLALLTCGLHLAFIEYFSGVELIRPFILWLLLIDREIPFRKQVQKILKIWLPYLFIFSSFLIYRLYLIPVPEPGYERNVPTVLFDLFRTPFSTAFKLIESLLQDSIYILITVWSNVFSPDLFKITQPANNKIIFIAILAGSALFYYLRHLEVDETVATENDHPWYRSALLVGLALTVLGPIPAWITGQSVSQDNPLWSGRLGMGSMVGASLVLVALMELFIKDRRYRTVFFVILIAFAISWHILYTNDYRWSWVKQQRFFHQLYWRAPYIKENTALISDEEIFPYMGEYPTAFALGNLYPKIDKTMNLNYWFYSALRRFNDQRQELIEGMPFEYDHNFGRFNGYSLDSLVIYYLPEQNQCLWVLSPEDATIRILPPILQDIAVISNLDRIDPAPLDSYAFPAEIFGEETENSWCYYYEKASLAQQNKDWDEIVRYWNTANENGFQPENGIEALPFIEGLAYSGDWAQARQLTIRANQITEGMKRSLCPLWERIAAGTQPDPARDETIQVIQDKVGCSE